MDFFNNILEFVKQQYATFGYLIVFLGAYFENTIFLGLILPGGSLVLLGAIYSSEGTMFLPLVILFGWLGMFLGNSTDFWLGKVGVLRLIEKSRFKEKMRPHLETARKFLDRRGGWAIFFSHFIGHIRSFVAITAGATRFPYIRFARFELAAALAWNIMYCLAGFFFAQSIHKIESLFSGLGISLVIVLVVAFLGYKAFGWWRERQPKTIRPAKKFEDQI